MAVCGLSAANSAVLLAGGHLECRAGVRAWAFSLRAPLSAVTAVALDDRRVLSWGVHGWRGRWLVNGSSSGIVRIDLDPPVRGRAVFFPVRVRELRIAVDDPDGLVAALRGRSAR